MGISVNPGATASRLGPQKGYPVIINGYETTISLTEDQALERGLIPAAPAPASQPLPAGEVEVTKAAPQPANKARRPSNKSAGGTDDGTGSASTAGI